MDNIIVIVVAAVVGLAIGFAIAKMMEKGKASRTIANAKKDAADIIKEAKKEGESVKKDKIFQAKEKFLELKAEHEKVIINKDKKIGEAEKRTRDKESQVSSELAKNKKLNDQLQEKIKEVAYKSDILEKKQSEVEKLHRSSQVFPLRMPRHNFWSHLRKPPRAMPWPIFKTHWRKLSLPHNRRLVKLW